MMKNVKPILASEIQILKNVTIPDEMIQAVNNLILKNWNGSYAKFLLDDVRAEYLSLIKIPEGRSTDDIMKSIYDNNQMDFEPIFRQAGWVVILDSPGYNENYHASFLFRIDYSEHKK